MNSTYIHCLSVDLVARSVLHLLCRPDASSSLRHVIYQIMVEESTRIADEREAAWYAMVEEVATTDDHTQ